MSSICDSAYYQSLRDEGLGRVPQGEVFTLCMWSSLLRIKEDTLISLMGEWWNANGEHMVAGRNTSCEAYFGGTEDPEVEKERISFEEFLTATRYEVPVFANELVMPKCYQCKFKVDDCQCLTLEQEQEQEDDRERLALDYAELCRHGHYDCEDCD
jgi:hypothetical protein